MKRCIILLGLGLLVLVFAGFVQSEDKKPEKPPAGALPPHPLDGAFENANSERAIKDALLNNDRYKKAVTEALKAKRAQEERFRKNPKLLDASPAQAARVKFLEVLRGEGKADK